MIKFEHTEVVGWEAAIRGMRNPLNSWEKSDSFQLSGSWELYRFGEEPPEIGPNDYDLMKRLRNAGTDHRKFMRMIMVYVDITAPLYWWKEFDTYKVGTVANSCSTMHTITDKEFELEDFSTEYLGSLSFFNKILKELNFLRDVYLIAEEMENPKPTSKEIWYNLIQILPTNYNQKRTVMMNYEVLSNIYKSRRNHKLDEWSIGFMDWINTLPYSEFITGKFKEEQ